MAFAWRISPMTVGFNLDECEERLLLAAWAQLCPLGREAWMPEFEDMFFNQGKGVSERVLANFDASLRAKGLARLTPRLSPSATSPYMRMRGEEKCTARRNLLAEMSVPARAEKLREQAERERAYLDAPDDRAAEQQELFDEAARRRPSGSVATVTPITRMSSAPVRTAAPLAPLPSPPVRTIAPPLDGVQPDLPPDALRWMHSDKSHEFPPPAPQPAPIPQRVRLPAVPASPEERLASAEERIAQLEEQVAKLAAKVAKFADLEEQQPAPARVRS